MLFKHYLTVASFQHLERAAVFRELRLRGGQAGESPTSEISRVCTLYQGLVAPDLSSFRLPLPSGAPERRIFQLLLACSASACRPRQVPAASSVAEDGAEKESGFSSSGMEPKLLSQAFCQRCWDQALHLTQPLAQVGGGGQDWAPWTPPLTSLTSSPTHFLSPQSHWPDCYKPC